MAELDELPQAARAALEQLKGVHDPVDSGARERVRMRVAAAVGVTATLGTASAAAAKTGGKGLLARVFAHKLVTAVGIVGVTGTGALVVQRALPEPAASVQNATPPHAVPPHAGKRHAPPAPTRPAVENTGPEAPVIEEAARTEVAAPAPAAKHERELRLIRPAALPVPGDSLAHELAMLRRAERAVDDAQPARALTLLAAYGAAYPSGRLAEEHMGLGTLATCSLQRPDAQAAARRFLQAFPHSLLAARVELACGLRPGEATK